MIKKLIAFIILIVSPFFPLAVFAQTTNTITLNPAIKYQTMTGWEATVQTSSVIESDTLGISKVEPKYALYKDYLFDQAVNDLGLNRLRLQVNPVLENSTDYFTQYLNGQINYTNQWQCYRGSSVNDNNDPNSINPAGFKWTSLDYQIDNIILPMRQKLQARGEKLYLNVNYVGFNKFTDSRCAGVASGLSNMLNTNVPEYAEYVLAVYQHIQSKYGFVPDAWEVSLEPENIGMNGTTMGNMIVAAAAKLSANGFTPNFIAPSTTSMGNASTWFDQIKAVPGALQYISEISYHRYQGVSDTTLQNIVTRATQNNKNTSMLEWISADYDTLHKDLTMGRNSAWAQYALAYGDTSAPNPNNDSVYYTLALANNTGSQIVAITNLTKFLRQYFKFIRAGAQRIEATTTNTAFDPVAFINSNGNYVVVVKATGAGSFSIGGLPPGTFGVKYTTNSQYDANNPDQNITLGQNLSTSIPATGVITIYQKSGGGPIPSPIKTGDIDGNGKVDIFDFNTLVTNFGRSGSNLPGDFDKNGKVDIFDFNTLVTNFGK